MKEIIKRWLPKTTKCCQCGNEEFAIDLTQVYFHPHTGEVGNFYICYTCKELLTREILGIEQ